MRIGVPKEIKVHEYRVGLTPTSVRELVLHGHELLVETGAGEAIRLDDRQYESAGARIAGSAEEVFAGADMIVKVKEPQPGAGAAARGPAAVHLSAPRARSRPDPGSARFRLRRDRL